MTKGAVWRSKLKRKGECVNLVWEIRKPVSIWFLTIIILKNWDHEVRWGYVRNYFERMSSRFYLTARLRINDF